MTGDIYYLGWESSLFNLPLLMHVPFPYVVGVCPPLGPLVPTSHISVRAASIVTGQYIYTEDLLKLDKCTDKNFPMSWPTSPSPICLSNWMEFILAHPDHRFASYIHAGLSTGFRIGMPLRCVPHQGITRLLQKMCRWCVTT